MQGELWNQYTDPIGVKNVINLCSYYKFIHKTKTKYKDKKSFKDDTVCIITHLIGPIGLYEACNLCIDSLGNI